MRRFFALTATAAAAASLAACGGSSDTASGSSCTPAHKFKTVAEGKLTVSSFDLPPYSMIEAGKLKGVDGAILDAIAKMECLEVVVQPMDTASVIPAAQNGRVDLAAGDWYRTEKRAAAVALSDPLYTDQMGVASKDGIEEIPKLKGKKVGTVDGYLWVEDLKAYLGSGINVYPTSSQMNQDLKAGRIEVAIDSFGSATYSKKDTGMQVKVAKADDAVAASKEPAQAAFPMAKGKDDLLKAINEDIKKLKDSGEFNKLLTANGLDESAGDTGEARLIP
ncbi:substrate-binding periplasmic protein [Actinomycetota bacterium]